MASVLDFANQYAATYGLTVTSHLRSPEKNAAVGGAKNSAHLTGMAVDLAGPVANMNQLAAWARQNSGPGKIFRQVLWQVPGHYDHVHLEFNADYASAVPGATAATGGTTVAPPTTPVDTDGLASDATPEQIRNWILSNKPEFSFLLNIPEVFDTVVEWVRQDEPEQDLVARVRNTQYWKGTTPGIRQFHSLQAVDPQAAQQQWDRTVETIVTALQREGMHIPDHEQMRHWATVAIWEDWDANPQLINRFVANWARGHAGDPAQSGPGRSQSTANTIIAMGKQYGVPMSEQSARELSLQVLEGTATMESVQAMLVTQARGRWASDPDVLAAIDAGITPYDFFSPHREIIGRTLEMDPNTIDIFDDPRWVEVSQHFDQNAKLRRSMTIGEVTNWARQRPEYGNTTEYRQKAAGMTLGLMNTLGVVRNG